MEIPNFNFTEVLSKYFEEPEKAEVLSVIQDNVLLFRFGERKYVIKRYSKEFSANRTDFITRVHNSVNKAMGFAPSVIPTLEDDLFVQFGGYSYDLTEFAPSTVVKKEDVTNVEDFFRMIGAFVGELHTSMAQFNAANDDEPNALLKINPPGGDHFKNLFADYEREQVDQEWYEVLLTKKDLTKIYAPIMKMPSRRMPKNIIHGDIYMKNLLFDENLQVKGAVDFARAGIFYRCYEIFRAFIQINKFFHGEKIDPAHLKIFLEAYLSTNHLETSELHAMLDLYIYTQAADISFLDANIVKNGGETAEYAKFRLQSLLTLHEQHDALQATINEVQKGIEKNEVEEVFELDSVNITLKSSDPDAIKMCHGYFDSYAGCQTSSTKDSWTIDDIVDDFLQESSLMVDTNTKIISIMRNSADYKMVTRVMRSLMMHEDANDGKTMFKGAALVNDNGKGIVLFGDKGVGKTSTMLDCLLNKDSKSNFVTNSHVSLIVKRDELVAYGYPMAVGVRLNALEEMRDNGSPHVVPLLEDFKAKGAFGTDDRAYIDPGQLEDYFTNLVEGCTGVDAIVLVQTVPSDQEPSLSPMSTAEAEEYLQEYYLKHKNRDEIGLQELLITKEYDPTPAIKKISAKGKFYLLFSNAAHAKEVTALLSGI